MNAVDVIRRLHAHRRWVNDQWRTLAPTLSDAQLHQPFDIGRGSLLATLVHLYAAEELWLQAIEGRSGAKGPDDYACASPAELIALWQAVEEQWAAYLAALTPAKLQATLEKKVSRTGEVFRTPLADALLHVCTHAQYTTAQGVNMLRRLGVDESQWPATMLITMSRNEQR